MKAGPHNPSGFLGFKQEESEKLPIYLLLVVS